MEQGNENIPISGAWRTRPHSHFDANQMQSMLLHRDGCVLILNKPAGIAVHKGAHKGADIESFFPHLQFGLPRVPALAHRLDRETSGCLVLGRHAQAIKRLGHVFSSNQVKKTYLALVVGAPINDSGVMDSPILKTGSGARWRIELHPDGQTACTHYQVLHRGEVSVLALTPTTGRTHQLRVHLAGEGFPIVGDPFYGVKSGIHSAEQASTMLHALSITVPFHDKKPPISVHAPLPEHMLACMQAHGIDATQMVKKNHSS